MRTRCLFLLVCVLGCLAPSLVIAQEVFNEHITQPDVWRPAGVSPPGVNAKGDLNLSIPVLTVPGRNGLNYNISFSYQSGIKVTQQSSWIGLGWSFDPGSITRDVKGASSVNGSYHGVDFAQAVSDMRDLYYVTSPGGSFSMMRLQASSNLSGAIPPRTENDGFMLLDWEPWVVKPDTTPAILQGATGLQNIGTLNTSQSDYRHFMLTDPSGIRYVFAAPTIMSYLSHDPYDAQLGADGNRLDYYVDTWRLVAILGTDYPYDPLDVPVEANIGSYLGNEGSWIFLTYSTPSTRHRLRTGYGHEVQQHAYLSGIYTPTHKAVFTTATKNCEVDCASLDENSDWLPSNSFPLQKLQTIKLFAGTNLVKRVELSHSQHNEVFGPASGSVPACPLIGVSGATCRLRLDGVHFTGSDDISTLPGYDFEYEAQYVEHASANNPADYKDFTDDLGYYNSQRSSDGMDKSTRDAAAWSLKKITYPTGGIAEVVYENDYIDLPVDELGDLALGNYLPYNIPYNQYDGGATENRGGAHYAIYATQSGFNSTHTYAFDPTSGGPSYSYYTETLFGKFNVAFWGGKVHVTTPSGTHYSEALPYNSCINETNPYLGQQFDCMEFDTDYGRILVSPTDNKIAFGSDANGPINSTKYGNQHQGGVRVFRMRQYGGHADTTQTTYYYGNGRLSGVPPMSWSRNRPYERYFKQNTRGQVAVYYNSIKEQRDDDTYTETYYTTDETLPGQVTTLNHTFYTHGIMSTLLQDNSQITWGRVIQQSQGSAAQRTEIAYSRIAGGVLVSPLESFYWWYKNGLTKEEINADGLKTERHYFRDLTTGMVKRVEEHAQGEPIRVTKRTYGYETSQAIFNDANMLTAVVREDMAQTVDAVNSEPAAPTCEGGAPCPVEVFDVLDEDLLNENCIVVGADASGEGGILKCPPPEGAINPFDANASYQESTASMVYYGSAVTQWADFAEEIGYFETHAAWSTWRPAATYAWKADAFAPTVPAFDYVNGSASSEWSVASVFLDYDPYGHVTLQQDAQGTQVEFFYGDSSGPCSHANATSDPSYLTCVRIGNLKQTIHYNDVGGIASLVDANGTETFFDYDVHQRLMQTSVNGPEAGAQQKVLQTHTYALSRDTPATGYNAASPNRITTTTPTGQTYYDGASPTSHAIIYQSIDYFDGFGQALQSQAKHANPVQNTDEYIVSAVERFPQLRKTRSYKPFSIQNGQGEYGVFSNAIFNKTSAESIFSITTPHTEEVRDGLGRVTHTYFPTIEASDAEARPVQTVQYKVGYQEAVDGTPLAGQALIVASTDEAGQITQTYSTAFGQNYLTRQLARLPYTGDGSDLPGSVSGVASVSGTNESGGYDPCSIECYEIDGVPYSPLVRDITVTWGIRQTNSFTATQTQVVHYTLTPPINPPGFPTVFTFKVHEGTCSSTKIVTSTSHVHNALDGSFPVRAGVTYCVGVQVGIAIEAGPQEQYDLAYALAYVKDGYITTYQDTRFAYDVAGNLVRVMPPNYFAPPAGSEAEDWVTTYQYNTLGQLVFKFTPDADANNDSDPTNDEGLGIADFAYAYDAIGNLRFSQDPNQRKVEPDPDPEKNKVEEVAFTAYDVLSRPLVTGVGPATFAGLDAEPGGVLCTETDTAFHTGEYALECTTDHWHTVQHYDAAPDANAFPWNAMPPSTWNSLALQHTNGRLVATAHRIDLEDVAIKEFLNLFGYTFNASAQNFQAHKSIDAQSITVMGDANVTFVAGERITLKTGFSVQGGGRFSGTLDTTLTETAGADWLITAYGYDAQGRINRYYQYNSILGLIQCEYVYDLQGNVIAVKYQPGKTDRLYTWYDYDDLGRLTTVWTHEQDNKAAATKEASYSYRANGQVQQLALGHPDFIAPVSYTYHVRDWLTHINNPDNIGENVFAMKLFYDAAPTDDGANTYATYRNGNVAAIDWVTQASSAPPRARYAFAYDGLNRLTQGRFTKKEGGTWSDWGASNKAYDLHNVQYDPNGNITSLHRKNQLGTGDPITYAYQAGSNRLMQASGGVLTDGATGVVTYTYDANGNAIAGRGFSDAEYDYRNLPTRMTVGGDEMAMRYYADGQRFYKALGASQGWYYIRGVDGSVIAVYDENCILRYWNILSGSRPIGRVEPAFGVALGQSAP